MSAFLKTGCWFSFFSVDLDLLFICFAIFYPVLFAFVVLGLVCSVLRQEIGWEERLQNDLFYIDRGV